MQMKRGDSAKGMRTFFASATSATDAIAGLISGGLSIPILLFGLGIGLALGLLVGWVIWPVEWSSARPTDLDPDAKAQYLAAVADSYAASQDTAALQIAQRRLNGVDVEADLPSAIAYFARGTQSEGAYQPPFEGSDAYQQDSAGDGNIRINNLKQLAGALGIEISNQVIPAPDVAPADAVSPGDGAAVVDDSASGTQPVQEPSNLEADTSGAASSDPFGDMSTVLGCMGALVLLFGGLALLYIFMQRRQGNSVLAQSQPTEPSSTEPPSTRAPATIVGIVEESSTLDEMDPVEGFRTESFHTEILEEADYSFDDEPLDEPLDDSDIAFAKTFGERGAVNLDAADVDTGFGREPYFGAADESQDDELSGTEILNGDRADDDSADGIIIDEFIASYHIGNLDYDQSHPIYASGSKNSIGEFGMGINTKNGIYLNSPEHVIALDVWLFDKTESENLSNETLVLLSEYAAENSALRESIVDEENGEIAPIVPEPGARFKLEGKNLFLLCEIIEVAFSPAEPAGIFEELEVKLTVFAKRDTA